MYLFADEALFQFSHYYNGDDNNYYDNKYYDNNYYDNNCYDNNYYDNYYNNKQSYIFML